MSIEHVIFDGFGTLVERRRPMSFYAHMQTPTSQAIAWNCAMTAAFDWRAWAQELGKEEQLDADLNSIVLYSDIAQTLRMLDYAGIGYSVMSNLASCYGPPLQAQLKPWRVQNWFLSYADGMKKPDSCYYQHALKVLDLPARHVLFVGDHAKHDVQGPALVGMNALRVRRHVVGMRDMLEPWC